jgi:uncharacterized protein YuzE
MGEQTVKTLRVNYDVGNDVLYCFLGEPQEAVSVEVADGVLLRVDPQNESRIVGFTVLDLRRRSLAQPDFEIPFEAVNLKSAA